MARTKGEASAERNIYILQQHFPSIHQVIRGTPVGNIKKLKQELDKVNPSSADREYIINRNKSLKAKRKFSLPKSLEGGSTPIYPPEGGQRSYVLKSGGKVKKNYAKGSTVRAAKY